MNAQEVALRQARDEIERLRGLLARLTEKSPWYMPVHDSVCFFCGGDFDDNKHAADCPWVAARKEVGK